MRKINIESYRLSVIIILLLASPIVSAQHEADNWIYGWGSWVNFSSGEPLTVPQFNAMFASYGSTSLSDSLGNLLFYSDGIDLYNRNHQLMLNSDGLMAAQWATNPCIAFPKPGDHSKYYLFTVGGRTGNTNRAGAEYSIIDMNLDGGNGAIISGQKNIPLQAADSAYETIQGFKHGSRDAYWVILRNHRSPNKFLSFLVDQAGVNQTPVVSSCILYFEPGGNQSEIMKASADGRYLLFADRNGTAGNPGMVELYSFNNITGLLTPKLLFNSNSETNTGSEFSANSEMLYLSSSDFKPQLNERERWICQYDMSKIDNLTQFENSAYKMVNDTSMFPLGNLLLANNGKIYFIHPDLNNPSSPGFLSAINDPSQQGAACDLQLKVVETGDLFEGLPTFISSFMSQFEWEGSCSGDTVRFLSRFNPLPNSIVWNFGDPASGSANTSTELDPVHVFFSEGEYHVSVTVTFPSGNQQTSNRTITIFPSPLVELGEPIIKCKDEPALISPGNGYASYLWNDGTVGQSLSAVDPGLYWVEVTNGGGCSARDSVMVTEYPPIQLIDDHLINSPTTCSGQTGAITGIGFQGQAPYYITWTNLISGNIIGHSPDIYNLGVGLYQISLTDGNGCHMPDSTIEIKDVGNVLIDTVTNTGSLCNSNNAEINVVAVSGLGSRIQYFIKHNNDTLIQWHNGIFPGLSPGVYYAWASDSSGCTCVYDQPIVITSPDGPEINEPIVLPATPGQADGSIILSATSLVCDTLFYTIEGITQINDGYFDNLTTGDYLCVVTDEFGCSTSVLVTVPPFDIQMLQAIAGEDATCLGHSARIPVYVSNFNGVKSFETKLIYNENIMDCIGFTNVHDSLVGSIIPFSIPVAGRVAISWTGAHSLSLPDNSVLLELVFGSRDTGNSFVNWDVAPGVNHFLDHNGLEIPVNYDMGSVVVNNPPVAHLSDKLLCEKDDFSFQPTVTGGTGTLDFVWQLPSGDNISQQELIVNNASAENNGTYIFKVTDEQNCADTATLHLTVVPSPIIGFFGDTIHFEDQYQLEAPQGYAHYQWSSGDTLFYLNVSVEGLYSIIVKTTEGCSSIDSVMMLKTNFLFEIPNAFTPNGDGINDLFRPVATTELINEFNLKVFNKWGQMVYNSAGINEGWDGSFKGLSSPADLYFWKIIYQTLSGRTEELYGNVMLIR